MCAIKSASQDLSSLLRISTTEANGRSQCSFVIVTLCTNTNTMKRMAVISHHSFLCLYLFLTITGRVERQFLMGQSKGVALQTAALVSGISFTIPTTTL